MTWVSEGDGELMGFTAFGRLKCQAARVEERGFFFFVLGYCCTRCVCRESTEVVY